MTLYRLPTTQGLLARKGAAVPVRETGAEAEPSLADADSTEGSARDEATEPFQLALVSIGDAGPMPNQVAEPPPAASLLPFTLYRKGRSPGAAVDAVASRPEPDAADGGAAQSGTGEAVENTTLVTPETAGALGVSIGDRTDLADAAAETARNTEQTEQTEQTDVVGLETATVGPLAATGRDPIVASERATPWSLILGGAAACAGVLGIAWIAFQFESPAPDLPAQTAKTAETAAPATPPTETSADSTPATAEPESPAAIVTAPPAPVDDGARASVDVVRIDNTGATVIAGRAAPHSEFILLDNGTPIGTVKADGFGEWVFVSSSPLPDGDHEFGLVPKSVTGTASVPATNPAPEPEAPAPDLQPTPRAAGDDEPIQELPVPPPPRKPDASAVPDGLIVPVPPRKPESRAGTEPAAGQQSSAEPSVDFVVQLASVKTRAGAEQEWQKLQRRFPGVLDGMSLSLHEAKLANQGTVIRVRTGPFVGLDDARDFCARIRAARQECLVVQTGDDD